MDHRFSSIVTRYRSYLQAFAWILLYLFCHLALLNLARQIILHSSYFRGFFVMSVRRWSFRYPLRQALFSFAALYLYERLSSKVVLYRKAWWKVLWFLAMSILLFLSFCFYEGNFIRHASFLRLLQTGMGSFLQAGLLLIGLEYASYRWRVLNTPAFTPHRSLMPQALASLFKTAAFDLLIGIIVLWFGCILPFLKEIGLFAYLFFLIAITSFMRVGPRALYFIYVSPHYFAIHIVPYVIYLGLIFFNL